MKWISVNTNGRYAVNRAGEVKNLETNKKLKPSFNKAGYLVVSLYDGQTHKRRTDGAEDWCMLEAINE